MIADGIEALRAHLETTIGVPCYTQIPPDRPQSFLYLDRVGGSAGLSHDEPMITVEAWAGTKGRAYALAQQTRDHMIRKLPPVINGVRIIRRREVTGVTYEPPTISGAFRYRWTITLRHQYEKEI